jgi:limonene 1,2-monooxygenase
LSIGAGLPGGPEAMASQWKIAEETAARHGTTMNRKDWRIVVGMHIAEDDEAALRQVKAGERLETTTYFEETLGRVPGTSDDPVRDGVKALTTLVGSPDTAIRVIERLLAASDGGFGGMMFRAHEWANREDTLKSYELFARYVMPRFQGSADTLIGSNQWIRDNRRRILGNNVEAVRRAFTDTGRPVPDEYRYRTVGAQDVDPAAGD